MPEARIFLGRIFYWFSRKTHWWHHLGKVGTAAVQNANCRHVAPTNLRLGQLPCLSISLFSWDLFCWNAERLPFQMKSQQCRCSVLLAHLESSTTETCYDQLYGSPPLSNISSIIASLLRKHDCHPAPCAWHILPLFSDRESTSLNIMWKVPAKPVDHTWDRCVSAEKRLY